MSLPAFAEMFWIGVATPLTAVCVLPLYPAFELSDRKSVV